MPKKYLIGVDLGTSSTKAAVYDLQGGLRGEAALEVPLLYPAPGQVEQESEDFYTSAAQSVQLCLQRAGIDPREVAGLALTRRWPASARSMRISAPRRASIPGSICAASRKSNT